VACAMPSMIPTILPLAFRYCVKYTGRIGYSISVEMSEKREAKASKIEFFVRPEKYFLTSDFNMSQTLSVNNTNQKRSYPQTF